MIKDFRDLVVWQKAMDLVESVYEITKRFPKEEMYALSSQLRRSVVSVPSNIAEGHGRYGKKEYTHHLSIAHGSLMECMTQVIIAQRLGYIDDNKSRHAVSLIESLSKKINALVSKLKQ